MSKPSYGYSNSQQLNHQRSNNHLPVGLREQAVVSRGLLRWQQLTIAEQYVAALVLTIPVFWLLGIWKFFMAIAGFTPLVYETWQNGRIPPLKRPSLPVVSLLAYGLFRLSTEVYYAVYIADVLPSPNFVIWIFSSWLAPAVLLWYIQSNKIRVRIKVVVWSCSVIILLMALFFLVINFGWNQAPYNPPRSLYGLLTGKSTTYIPGAGNTNYLIPYFSTDESFLPGLVRYLYFFQGPEALALFLSFVSLTALDIKERWWAIALIALCFFLLLTSGTRSVLSSLPIVFLIYYANVFTKKVGTWATSGLIAIACFFLLSVPPIAQPLLNTALDTSTTIANTRADSTEVRSEIYRRTWQEIVNGSYPEYLFGHFGPTETVLPGYAPSTIGSHSFYLGTLLFRSGLIGTSFFVLYWFSLIFFILNAEHRAPSSSLAILTLFTITFCVMEIELPVIPVATLCATLKK